MAEKKKKVSLSLSKQQAMEKAASLITIPVSAPPPPGYFSADEFAALRQVSIHRAQEMLRHLYREGQLDRAKSGRGFVYGFKEEKS